MSRYLILFKAPDTATVFMAKATIEERQAGMERWMKWKDSLAADVKFEFGMPLQARQTIRPDGQFESSDTTSGHAFMEAPKLTDIEHALKEHPHLDREGASIEILEFISTPTT